MKPKHILIVDDEVGFTRLLKLNLERLGQHTVTIVNRPHEALAVARKDKPDLILLDVIMPGVDGTKLAENFKADPILWDVPIVFLTATVSQAESAHKGLQRGGFIFLSKPVELADLEACLAQHLAQPTPNQAQSPTPSTQAPRPTT